MNTNTVKPVRLTSKAIRVALKRAPAYVYEPQCDYVCLILKFHVNDCGNLQKAFAEVFGFNPDDGSTVATKLFRMNENNHPIITNEIRLTLLAFVHTLGSELYRLGDATKSFKAA